VSQLQVLIIGNGDLLPWHILSIYLDVGVQVLEGA